MATWRKLHQKTTESMDVNDMPDDFTRLLWVLLPLALCKEGRGIYNFSWIRSKLFPLRDDVANDRVRAGMEWFADREMVQIYQENGREYFRIPSWHDYQNTAKEADSPYPAPSVQSNSGATPELGKNKGGIIPEPVPTKSVLDKDIDSDKDVDEDLEKESDGSHSDNPTLDQQHIQDFLKIVAVPFTNHDQADEFHELIYDFGKESVFQAAQWCAEKGMSSMTKVIRSMATALPGWKANGKHPLARGEPEDPFMAAIERRKAQLQTIEVDHGQ
ncbi:MAG: hypothetical protein JEZ06_00355 [Anaerolineaceae bacterium]|nr:hypothetical protein [Anaerolineaceae bacterium]